MSCQSIINDAPLHRTEAGVSKVGLKGFIKRAAGSSVHLNLRVSEPRIDFLADGISARPRRLATGVFGVIFEFSYGIIAIFGHFS